MRSLVKCATASRPHCPICCRRSGRSCSAIVQLSQRDRLNYRYRRVKSQNGDFDAIAHGSNKLPQADLCTARPYYHFAAKSLTCGPVST